MYRDAVKIPKAGFLDDLLDITYCGLHTQQMNNYTNEEISKRKMHFSLDKCKRMHIGKYKKCANIEIDNWEVKCEEKNLSILPKNSY